VTRTAQIAFLDVTYAADAAGVACLLADTWTTTTPAMEITRCLPCAPAEYMSGQFYKRELPLLRAVIDHLTSRPSMLVIDGYVSLGQPTHRGWVLICSRHSTAQRQLLASLRPHTETTLGQSECIAAKAANRFT